jgi:hypothetical protein
MNRFLDDLGWAAIGLLALVILILALPIVGATRLWQAVRP